MFPLEGFPIKPGMTIPKTNHFGTLCLVTGCTSMGHLLGNPEKNGLINGPPQKKNMAKWKITMVFFFRGTSSFIAGFAIVMLVFGKVTIPWINWRMGTHLGYQCACFRWYTKPYKTRLTRLRGLAITMVINHLQNPLPHTACWLVTTIDDITCWRLWNSKRKTLGFATGILDEGR